jgi:hypothetical protein
VTDDIDVPTSQTLNAVGPRERGSAEDAMRATIVKALVVSVPVAIVIFVGMVALALRNQQPDWTAYLLMAAGIGVIAGVFFGLLIGVTLTSHDFE